MNYSYCKSITAIPTLGLEVWEDMLETKEPPPWVVDRCKEWSQQFGFHKKIFFEDKENVLQISNKR